MALFLKLLDEGVKLDEVVTVDLGDEYQAVYDTLLFAASVCLHEGIKFTVLAIPETDEYREYVNKTGSPITMFEFLAFFHVKQNGKAGYGWCGKQRWGTSIKNGLLNNYYQSTEKFIIEYVGIAVDETHRIDIRPHKNYTKSYPLVKWGMTEADCLEYCNCHGLWWIQDGVKLYDILDRVSCQHCQQKNLKELRNIKRYLPKLWDSFKIWQNSTEFPYRSNGDTIYDLDRRFAEDGRQISIFDAKENNYGKD